MDIKIILLRESSFVFARIESATEIFALVESFSKTLAVFIVVLLLGIESFALIVFNLDESGEAGFIKFLVESALEFNLVFKVESGEVFDFFVESGRATVFKFCVESGIAFDFKVESGEIFNFSVESGMPNEEPGKSKLS